MTKNFDTSRLSPLSYHIIFSIMKNTREKILDQLLALQNATISDLSDILGISEISVRHHLISLQADELVCSSEERHGVGRPRFVYNLTSKGYEAIPTNFLQLSNQALATMKRVLGKDAVIDLLRQIGKDLADAYQSSEAPTPEQLLPQIVTRLSQEGFYWTWHKTGDTYTLTSRYCPFLKLGQNHPEICTINQALLESLIEQPVVKSSCVLRGDKACAYTFEVL